MIAPRCLIIDKRIVNEVNFVAKIDLMTFNFDHVIRASVFVSAHFAPFVGSIIGTALNQSGELNRSYANNLTSTDEWVDNQGHLPKN